MGPIRCYAECYKLNIMTITRNSAIFWSSSESESESLRERIDKDKTWT